MKPQLLLIPPFMANSSFWHHQTEALGAVADIHIPKTTEFNDISSLAEHILKNAPDQFYLAGLSMGGYISLEIMRQLLRKGEGARVKKLCLMGTNFRADTKKIQASREVQMAAALDGKLDQVYASVIPILVHERFHKDIDFLTELYSSVVELGPEVFVRQQLVNISRSDSSDILSKITCPTLLICGREDILSPISYQTMMQEFMPHADLLIIDECGHFSAIEQPDAVTNALKQWLID